MPEEQLSLLPDKPLKFDDKTINLEDLPPDSELIGPEPTREMLEQTKALGAIIEPIIMTEAGDTSRFPCAPCKYVIIRGRRRIKAARACDLTTIRARIIAKIDWQIGVSLDLSAHATRKDNAAAEVTAIRVLMEAHCTEKHIHQATGLPMGTIRKRLELIKLIPALYEAMLRGRIRPGVAEGAAKFPQSLQVKLAALLEANGTITGQDVAGVRKARQEEAMASLPFADFAPIGDPPAGSPPAEPAGPIPAGPVDRPPTREEALDIVRRFVANASEDERLAFQTEVLGEVLGGE